MVEELVEVFLHANWEPHAIAVLKLMYGWGEDTLPCFILTVVRPSLVLHFTWAQTQSHFLSENGAPVANCWPVTVNVFVCVRRNLWACICVRYWRLQSCIVCQPRPQVLTSPSFTSCPFYLEKRTQGHSSIIQHTTTNLCLANNSLCKHQTCNNSNPMSSHDMDQSLFQVSQIDQS